MRPDAVYLVKRYTQILGVGDGQEPQTHRRVTLAQEADTVAEALHWAASAPHDHPGSLWIERRGQPAWGR